MNLGEMVYYSLDYLQHHKLRSFLTVLGIIVGISSIILLVGLVQGLKQDVLSELSKFGSKTLIIIPMNPQGGGAAPGEAALLPTSGKLFETDFERVKKMPEIDIITDVIIGSTTVSYKDQQLNSQVYGVEPIAFSSTTELELSSGRFLSDNDHQAAVVGSQVAENFKQPPTANAEISIGGRPYRVVGVLKTTGASFSNIDGVVFIPFKEAQDIFNESLAPNEVSAIYMTMKDGTNMTAATDEVEQIMLSSHRVTEDTKDFGVISPSFIDQQYTSILDLLTTFLGAIASIALIVGGIGILNTMFMSVIERRREIGTMKAIGATSAQIRDLFLVESSIIGLSGGILGTIISLLIGLGIIYIAHVSFVFDWPVIAGALAFSVLLGIVSGTAPAMDAARVDAIVALRYE